MSSALEALTRHYLKAQRVNDQIRRAEIVAAETKAREMWAEALAIDRELEARRLIRMLLEQTNSKSVHADCAAWLEVEP